MKNKLKVFCCILIFSLFLLSAFKTKAIYNPLSVPNNKVGIHILFPSEISDAAQLVNANGGDWGYVTIPIQQDDLNLIKWQHFMDQAKALHVIPIIRIATVDDYFNKNSWSAPTNYDVVQMANFLNSLSWPTKNRYIVVYNEPNDADEWGGSPDPAAYANILSFATSVFKQRSKDFFIISAGLDNAAANVPGQSIDEYTFMREMNQAVPGIFGKIDGISSHSYPNPGFEQPPSYYYEGIYSFYYQENLASYLGGKTLPIFITETGWDDTVVNSNSIASYYQQTFKNQWSNSNIVAITPFLLSGSGPYAGFSFTQQNGGKTPEYNAIENLSKTKGQPQLSQYNSPFIQPQSEPKNLPTYNFKTSPSGKNFNVTISKNTMLFLKWMLRY